MWVLFFDQRSLPITAPAFEFLFAGNRLKMIVEYFKINQLIDAIPSGEPGNDLRLVFGDTTNQVIRHADIKSALRLAGEDVNVKRHVSISRGSRLAQR